MQKKIIIINNKNRNLFEHLSELYSSKYLIYELSKKEFKSAYTQTLLGPIFFFLLPFIQALVFSFFTVKFDIDKISGIPTFIFFLIGITLWNFFSLCTIKCSGVFFNNRKLIDKAYFNRLIFFIVASFVCSIHFLINLISMFLLILFYKYFYQSELIIINIKLLLIPLVAILTIILSISIGMIISALSIRHRDLIYGLPFIFQMLIFLSPVLYPLNNTINIYNSFFFIFNPFSSLVELFRFIFIKDYVLLFNIIIINFVEILVLWIVGFQMFKRVEKTVQDLI